MIMIAIISISLTGYIWISYEYNKSEDEIIKLKNDYFQTQRSMIKNETIKVVDYIEFMKSQTDCRLKDEIKNRTYEAYEIAMNLYKENKDSMSIDKIKKLVKDALRAIRFNKERGYYFATSLDGVEQLFADRPELEGENLLEMQDTKGKFVIRDMIEIIGTKKEGYYNYSWTKPNTKGASFPKIAFIKYFKPFDWLIGTGEYLDDVEKDIRIEVINRIDQIRFGEDGYIIAYQKDGLSLTGPVKGKNLLSILDDEKVKNFKQLENLFKSGGGFLTYDLPDLGKFRSGKKLSYIKSIDDWKWFVGAGVYIDNIDKLIKEKEILLRNEVQHQVKVIILILVLILLMIILIARRVLIKTRKSFETFESFFKEASTDNVLIDEKELHYEEFSRLADYANKMIEERKNAQEALSVSSEIVKAIPSGLFIYKHELPDRLILLDGNPASEKLTGIKLDESRGKEFNDIWLDSNKYKTKNLFMSPFKTGKNFEVDDLYYKDRNIEGTFRVRVFTIPGDLLGIAFENITQQRQAEFMLKNFFSLSLDLLCIADIKGNFKYVNPAFERTLGYSNDELISKPYISFVHEDDIASTNAVGDELLEGHPIINFENRYKTKSGVYIWLSWKSMPVPELGITYAVARDITKEKIDLIEKAKLEAQLYQAQKMEALGTLAGGVAHDFNNLLMGILGNISLILIGIDESNPDFEKLKTIESHVQNATELTKQLLGFARGGKYEVKPTDLNILIEKNIKMFGRTKKEISIHTKFEENIWNVEVDRGQLDQVLLNLYVNAWQAMPKGGNLFIQTRNEIIDENFIKPYQVIPGKYVKISIADTGIGMDDNTLRRIFEPFFTTKKIGRGTGLGLASAYGIIKNHGGFIDVTSKLGEGTTFDIYLPITDKVIQTEKATIHDLITGNESILFIDDEEMILDVGKQFLERLGYKVSLAKNGFEALKYFRENKDSIDLVLLDMIMPEMSGSETFDNLKTLKPDVKVLLSSGYSIDGQAQYILERGCDGFIQKPFNIEEISEKIREILSK
jgi:two-component system, cell cycle sensor histidine kinase and response regulator CckA